MDPLFFTFPRAFFCFFCVDDDTLEGFEPALPAAPDFFFVTEAVRRDFFLESIETDFPFLFSADALALMDSFFFLLRSNFTENIFFVGILNILIRSFFSVIRSLVDFLFLGVAINLVSRLDFLIRSTVSLTDSAKGSM